MNESIEIIVCLAILASPIVLGLIICVIIDIIEKFEFERFLYEEVEG